MNYAERGREILDLEIRGLEQVRDRLGAEFTRGAEVFLACLDNGGKIVVSGMGKNWHVGQKISATLASTGSTSVVLNPSQALHGDLGILSERDALLVLSYSGDTEELLRLIPLVKRRGVPVVSITGREDSPLAQHSDVVIPASVPREACPFNMAPTASTTAALAVGDALAMVLLEARGFEVDDYARLHPGGTIGRTLLLRAGDIMRRRDRLVAVGPDSIVREVLVAMTGKRAGSAAVIDGEGRPVGIITDGDLRRHLTQREDVLGLRADQIMSGEPVCVRDDDLAADVLRTFEEHSIDDLLVVDDVGALVGAVDIQDLPKLKIL